MAEKQAGMTIVVENQDLKGHVQIPGAFESEYEKWKEALNVNTEVTVTGASIWHSADDRKTLLGPNATENVEYKKGYITYADGGEKTRFEGKFSAKEIAALEAMVGKVGVRDIQAVVVM